MKRCPRCGETKTFDEFGWRIRESGNRTPRGLCKPCARAATRAWEEQNPEKLRAIRTAGSRSWRAANPERNLEHSRAWQRENRDKQRASNRRWTAANPGKHRARVNRYRARKAGAIGSASADQIAARVAFYGGCCWVCRGDAEAIDHVKPLDAGGSNWPANLRPICRACNAAKGHRWPL